MTREDAVFDFDTIELAFEYANFDDHSNEAFLDRHTGTSLYFSMLGDSDAQPDDFDDATRYIAIPDTRDFGLGSQLTIDFVSEFAPSLIDAVQHAFDRRGGFRRFKDLIERQDLLDQWYKHEADHEHAAILQWCDENKIRYTLPQAQTGG